MLTRKEIIEAIHNGSLNAAEKYEKWSRGWTVFDSGVEGILVAGIAESLHDSQGNYGSLLLEVPFKEILEWSGADQRGRPRSTLRGSKRMDIVLFNDQERPICAIEVKRTWNRKECFEDLERLRDLVDKCSHQKGGSLKRGFLTMLLQESDMKGKEIEEIVRDEFPHDRVKIRFHGSKRKDRSGLIPFSIEIFALNT